MFKRILVPLDGSSLAEAVLPVARYMAERFQAALILLHIIEKGAPERVHGQRHLQQASDAREYLAQIAARLSQDGITVEQEVHEKQESGVAHSIYSHAEELYADLIALCAHGHGGLRDMLFGSIAQQVIRQGNIPVLFIRPDQSKSTTDFQYRQLLIPLDGLQAHEIALPVGAAVASHCHAAIKLLTVVPTAETLPAKQAVTGRLLPGTTMMTLDASVQQAEEYLLKIARDLLGQGLTVSVTVSRGDAASKMMEVVETEKIDMIVMGTHGHYGFDASWEGSLTPKVLSSSHVPVLLVKGKHDDNRGS